uniref:Uncharacterized protein n=1 Tax=Amphimedon queenslandica TaxID=400682 RepID=A0A1X7V788_AMPQE
MSQGNSDSNKDEQMDGEDEESNDQGTSQIQLSVSLPHNKEESKDVQLRLLSRVNNVRKLMYERVFKIMPTGTVSHTTVINLLNELEKGYDIQVCKWKDSILDLLPHQATYSYTTSHVDIHEVQDESDQSFELDDNDHYNSADVLYGSEIDVLPSEIDNILTNIDDFEDDALRRFTDDTGRVTLNVRTILTLLEGHQCGITLNDKLSYSGGSGNVLKVFNKENEG